MFEQEINTYNENLPELLKTDVGSFILIKGNSVVGVFKNIQDALNIGYEKFKSDGFFVKEIIPFPETLNFATNQFVV